MKTPRNSIDALFRGRLQAIVLGTLCSAGLLGRWRPISGHHPESFMKYPG